METRPIPHFIPVATVGWLGRLFPGWARERQWIAYERQRDRILAERTTQDAVWDAFCETRKVGRSTVSSFMRLLEQHLCLRLECIHPDDSAESVFISPGYDFAWEELCEDLSRFLKLSVSPDDFSYEVIQGKTLGQIVDAVFLRCEAPESVPPPPPSK